MIFGHQARMKGDLGFISKASEVISKHGAQFTHGYCDNATCCSRELNTHHRIGYF